MTDVTSRDYARDAEAARRRLNDKLGELQDGVTPGRLLDEVLSYGKNGGAFFLKALNNAARDNPLPTMLVGAGCAMFLAEKSGLMQSLRGEGADAGKGNGHAQARGRVPARSKDSGSSLTRGIKAGVHDAAESVAEGAASIGEAAGSMGRRVAGAVGGAIESAEEAAGAAKRRVVGAVDGAIEGAEELAGAAKRRVEGALEDVGERVSELSDRTSEQANRLAQQLKDRTAAFMNEQPLLAAAIGIAIGAVVAAALPVTELEDELVGETSDAVKKTVTEVASEQLEVAKSAAASVAEQAKSAAERAGLTPDAVADAARDLGERVGQVVTEVADAATTEVKERARSEG